MADQQQPPKLAGARERVAAVARSAAGPKPFVIGLVLILAVILIRENSALVPISLFGITFNVPGILWYALLFACGALVGVWFEGRWRAR